MTHNVRKTVTAEVKADGKVKWMDVSRYTSGCKAWMQVVEDYDADEYKYNYKSEWVDKTDIGGYTHFDVSELAVGSLVRISGASTCNDKTRYAKITNLTESEIEMDTYDEETFIEMVLESDDENMKQEIINMVNEIEDEEKLAEIKEMAEGFVVGERL